MPNLITTAEAATYLSLSPRTLELWRYKKTGPPFVKAGSAVRYSTEALAKWLEDSAQDGQA